MGEHRNPNRQRRQRADLLTPQDPQQRIAAAFVVALLLVLALVALATVGPVTVDGTALPPTPPGPSATPSVAPPTANHPTTPSKAAAEKSRQKRTARTARSACPARTPAIFGGTAPAEICVPSIGVDASVMELGLNSDRTVQVPPLSEVGDAGWYKYSAVPGTRGPTVILGHIDSAQYGDGVFFELGKLTSGDRVMITRDDGTVATYSIDRVDEVSKTAFPTMSVYGPTAGATIRLVTCGGQFDAATGNYLDNIIAYGTLRSVRKA